MAAPAATWTVIEAADYVAGSVIRKTKFLEDVLQNIHWLGTAHNHGGGAGSGALIATADAKSIWFYGDDGGPFA